jgi:hypothetical protein
LISSPPPNEKQTTSPSAAVGFGFVDAIRRKAAGGVRLRNVFVA